MHHCRLERKSKTDRTTRSLAGDLGKTENYISAIENGRVLPSMKTFLHYLVVNGFDPEPLTQLSISEFSEGKISGQKKSDLIDRIYQLDEDAVNFLAEQAKVAEGFKLKVKKKP